MARPFIFKTEQELKDRINEYWSYCEENEKPMTFCGLAYYLGMTRQSLHNYSTRQKYGDIIEEARDRIQMDTEERLQIAGQATTGIIFSLKNNYHWDADNRIKAETKIEATNKNYDLSNLTDEQLDRILKSN